MADTQETIADIIAEKRRRADEIERDCAEKMKRGEMTSDQYARELVADIRKEADRLEAAYKREKAAIEADALAVGGIVEAARRRERGNSAALREALKAAELGLFRWLSGSISRDEHRELVATIKTALAAPPRNCDRFGGDNAKLQKVYYSECGKEYEPRDPISRQAYFVGYGNWLLALAQKGGAK